MWLVEITLGFDVDTSEVEKMTSRRASLRSRAVTSCESRTWRQASEGIKRPEVSYAGAGDDNV
ncbi:hypothetical protein GQ44DRAFT_717978 [Phaeosphaeriaceae sp. PMI808]|nr:hypothetical protein GQ44DRAFT_717978 [Phaeosphaeriaceae sp. PMI808]